MPVPLGIVLPVVFGTLILVVLTFLIVSTCTSPQVRVYRSAARRRPAPDPEKGPSEAAAAPVEPEAPPAAEEPPAAEKSPADDSGDAPEAKDAEPEAPAEESKKED